MMTLDKAKATRELSFPSRDEYGSIWACAEQVFLKVLPFVVLICFFMDTLRVAGALPPSSGWCLVS